MALVHYNQYHKKEATPFLNILIPLQNCFTTLPKHRPTLAYRPAKIVTTTTELMNQSIVEITILPQRSLPIINCLTPF